MPISNNESGGSKGSYSYRGKVLKGLQQISDNTKGDSGLQNAITLLTQAVKDHQEFELKLVRDTGNDQIVVQRNEYDEETGNWTLSYADATGAPYTLVGSPEYLDASTSINLLLSSFNSNAGNERTPGYDIVTNAGSLALVAYDVSVSNTGVANGTVLGKVIKPGVTLNFNAGGLNNYYNSGAFTYDATGTELILIYNS